MGATRHHITSLKMSPEPFCCSSAIPSTIRYLSLLLPKQTTHNPLPKNKSSTPIITSFLVHLSTNTLPIPDTVPEGYSPNFYAIIQVKRSHLVGQNGNARSTISSASSSSTSVHSTPST